MGVCNRGVDQATCLLLQATEGEAPVHVCLHVIRWHHVCRLPSNPNSRTGNCAHQGKKCSAQYMLSQHGTWSSIAAVLMAAKNYWQYKKEFVK